MEFVPGQTLEERIEGQPLPLPEAIRAIALQIIEALEAAHDNGIVHRDLKPGKRQDHLRRSSQSARLRTGEDHCGRFGRVARGRREPIPSTVTLPSTRVGIIVGTPAYMSPEQAKGLPVDRRTDIFAFGCVLFEMLTGRRAFGGGTEAEVMSRVLQREPDWTLLPSGTSPSIERLLRLCLEKNPRLRRQSAGDVRVDLEHVQSAPEPEALPRVQRWQSGLLTLLGGTLAAFAALAAWVSLRDRDAAPPEMRTQLVTPHTLDPMHFAVSPDGAQFVFAAPEANAGVPRLYLRAMNTTEARPLPGTDGARYPFWSPDSRSIGFFADRKLFRVDISGGRPQVLAHAANAYGAAWGKDGTILFAPTTVSPLFRVPASGGKLVAATELHSPRQTNHRGPSFLPDGRRFLFYAVAAQVGDSGGPDESGIYLGSLDGGAPKRLVAADSAAVYVPPDRIVFVEQSKLVARRIDLARGEVSGDPVTVAEPVRVTNRSGLVLDIGDRTRGLPRGQRGSTSRYLVRSRRQGS